MNHLFSALNIFANHSLIAKNLSRLTSVQIVMMLMMMDFGCKSNRFLSPDDGIKPFRLSIRKNLFDPAQNLVSSSIGSFFVISTFPTTVAGEGSSSSSQSIFATFPHCRVQNRGRLIPLSPEPPRESVWSWPDHIFYYTNTLSIVNFLTIYENFSLVINSIYFRSKALSTRLTSMG